MSSGWSPLQIPKLLRPRPLSAGAHPTARAHRAVAGRPEHHTARCGRRGDTPGPGFGPHGRAHAAMDRFRQAPRRPGRGDSLRAGRGTSDISSTFRRHFDAYEMSALRRVHFDAPDISTRRAVLPVQDWKWRCRGGGGAAEWSRLGRPAPKEAAPRPVSIQNDRLRRTMRRHGHAGRLPSRRSASACAEIPGPAGPAAGLGEIPGPPRTPGSPGPRDPPPPFAPLGRAPRGPAWLWAVKPPPLPPDPTPARAASSRCQPAGPAGCDSDG